MIKEFLAQRGRQVRLSVVEKGSDVVLEGALTSSLVVEKEGLAIVEHYVARLKVAIEKIVVRRGKQEFGKTGEVVFQRLLAKGNAGETEKVIFEVVQIPGDGLAIEAGAGIADFVI